MKTAKEEGECENQERQPNASQCTGGFTTRAICKHKEVMRDKKLLYPEMTEGLDNFRHKKKLNILGRRVDKFPSIGRGSKNYQS
jgi:hypothetical protein